MKKWMWLHTTADLRLLAGMVIYIQVKPSNTCVISPHKKMTALCWTGELTFCHTFPQESCSVVHQLHGDVLIARKGTEPVLSCRLINDHWCHGKPLQKVSGAWAGILFYYSKRALTLYPCVTMNVWVYELNLSFLIASSRLGVVGSKGLLFWWASQGESDSALRYLQQVDIPLSCSRLLSVRLLPKDCNDTELYLCIIGHRSQ